MKAEYQGIISKLYECKDEHAIVTITTSSLSFLLDWLQSHAGSGEQYTVEFRRRESETSNFVTIFDTSEGDDL